MRARVLGLGWVTPGGWGGGAGDAEFRLGGGELPPLARKDFFAEPYPRFGRLDAFSRLGLAAVALALGDAGLEQWREKRPIGLVATSRFGCLATDLDFFRPLAPGGDGLVSPNLFAYTVPNTVLGEAAIRFGLSGPGYVLSAGAEAPFASLETALDILAAGEAEAMVAGCCELPPADATAAPGAVFLVLGVVADGAGAGAGHRLEFAPELQVNGTAVSGWAELVAACRGPA
jgi:3-oxoacyl-[acyl-carrier-protein] synthase II